MDSPDSTPLASAQLVILDDAAVLTLRAADPRFRLRTSFCAVIVIFTEDDNPHASLPAIRRVQSPRHVPTVRAAAIHG
jgi:hypothetical protein